MKIEPRGKFGGVKVHLDKIESELLMEWAKKYHIQPNSVPNKGTTAALVYDIGYAIAKLAKKHPDLLEDKPEDQIKKTLEYEAEKATKKLQAMADGQAWDPKKGIELK